MNSSKSTRSTQPGQAVGAPDFLNGRPIPPRLADRGHLDFVDANPIGNKKAVKEFLPDLIAWQKKKGFPFTLATQASINLADDFSASSADAGRSDGRLAPTAGCNST